MLLAFLAVGISLFGPLEVRGQLPEMPIFDDDYYMPFPRTANVKAENIKSVRAEWVMDSTFFTPDSGRRRFVIAKEAHPEGQLKWDREGVLIDIHYFYPGWSHIYFRRRMGSKKDVETLVFARYDKEGKLIGADSTLVYKGKQGKEIRRERYLTMNYQPARLVDEQHLGYDQSGNISRLEYVFYNRLSGGKEVDIEHFSGIPKVDKGHLLQVVATDKFDKPGMAMRWEYDRKGRMIILTRSMLYDVFETQLKFHYDSQGRLESYVQEDDLQDKFAPNRDEFRFFYGESRLPVGMKVTYRNSAPVWYKYHYEFWDE